MHWQSNKLVVRSEVATHSFCLLLLFDAFCRLNQAIIRCPQFYVAFSCCFQVRQCAWWNERLGTNGAWDPSACTTTSTDANKTSCECTELGSIAVISELSERFLIHQATECAGVKIVKYIGIGASIIACLVFVLGSNWHFLICCNKGL